MYDKMVPGDALQISLFYSVIHFISCYVVSSKCDVFVFIFLSLDVTSPIHLFIPAPLMSQYIFSFRCKHDGVRVEMLL